MACTMAALLGFGQTGVLPEPRHERGSSFLHRTVQLPRHPGRSPGRFLAAMSRRSALGRLLDNSRDAGTFLARSQWQSQ